ncbi:MAG: LysR substrate-binding domain-containing protein [Pseudomonadota bacterium]
MRLPFKSMETVEAAVRLGGFTRAALELGLTQSAISNSIRRFEQELGLKLFTRQGGQIEPTTAAIEIAGAVAEARELLESKLTSVKGGLQARSVALTIAPTFASRWLAPRLPRMRSAIAPAKVSILSRADLIDQADIWIRNARVGKWPGLVSKHLMNSIRAPVASPELIGRSSVSDDDVLSLPLLGVEARPSEWSEWAVAAGLVSSSARSDFSFDVTSSTWDAAIAGSGVALGDLSMLRSELEEGKLVRLGTTTMSSYSYFVCRRRGDRRTAVKQVWDWFVANRHRTA